VQSFLREHRFFLLLLGIYVLFATVMLDEYPRVWVDEPWEAATGYTLATQGKMYNPVLENYSGFDRVFLQPRLFLSIAVAPAFAMFGFGPLTGRLVSGPCGAFLLIALYLFSSKFFSKRAALLSVWFVTIETMMFISYRTIRPEIYLVTFEIFSLWLFFRGMQTRTVRDFFWSGLLCGVAMWTHPNALLHICALAVVFFIVYGKRAWVSKFGWCFAGAVFLGVLPYLIYVIFYDAHNSLATFYLQLDNRTSDITQRSWLLISAQGEWKRIVEYAQFPNRAPIILILLTSWIFSFLSKKEEARYVAIMVVVHASLSFLLIWNKTILYSTSILPLLCILTAYTIDSLLGSSQTVMVRMRKIFSWQYWRETTAAGLFIILSLNQLGGDARLVWRNRDCSYSKTIQQLQSVIPKDARVWGSMTFWFGFYQQPYRSQYTYFRELDSFKPQYMITGDPEVWGKDFWLPVREKAEETVRSRGTLVAEFSTSCYGKLQVYRLQW